MKQITHPATRFWQKVEKTETCWNWIAGKHPSGHGQISVGGRKGRPQFAHRLSYEWEKGPVPDGLCVCHKCDNPSCVRPDHLFVGTRKDNLDDMRRKNRQARGQVLASQGNARLTESQVLEIRKKFKEGYGRSPLSREYKCTWQNIDRIVKRITWNNI
jgi:hypothetical protein